MSLQMTTVLSLYGQGLLHWLEPRYWIGPSWSQVNWRPVAGLICPCCEQLVRDFTFANLIMIDIESTRNKF